jgi:hypothetical protein
VKDLGNTLPHAFKVNWVYELPLGRGRALFNDSSVLLDRIIGGFELFRQLDWLKAILPAGFDPIQLRMLAVGTAMVMIMRWRPRGLVTKRDPTVYLKEKKAVSTDLAAQGHG